MSRKIVFASSKGGVGKSTISTNIAVGAAQLGKDVILLDADIPMANLALSLGMDIEGPTLHEVLSGEAEISDVLYEGPNGMRVIPTGVSIDGVRKSNTQELERVVKDLSDKAEIIVIDAPSGLGPGSVTALRTSDELVLVTDPVITSLSDALRTKEVAERFNTKALGVVISRTADSESDVPNEEIESMLNLPTLGVIPEDPEIQKSTSVGETVMNRKPDSPSAKAFQELTSEIFIKRGEMDYEWLAKQTVSEIKEIAQKRDIDYQNLLKVEEENQNRKTLKNWMKTKIKESREEDKENTEEESK